MRTSKGHGGNPESRVGFANSTRFKLYSRDISWSHKMKTREMCSWLPTSASALLRSVNEPMFRYCSASGKMLYKCNSVGEVHCDLAVLHSAELTLAASAVLGMTQLSSPMERRYRNMLQKTQIKRREGHTWKLLEPAVCVGVVRRCSEKLKNHWILCQKLVIAVGVNLLMTHCLFFTAIILHFLTHTQLIIKNLILQCQYNPYSITQTDNHQWSWNISLSGSIINTNIVWILNI